MKPSLKIFLGILTAVVLLAFIPTYDLLLKDKIDSIEVVVVKAGVEVKPTETISEEQLTIERRRKQDLVDGIILKDDIQSIIGYDAADLIVGNSMISTKMIDYDEMIPNEAIGEAIRPILSDWILAKPGSLRRKDTIDIYTVNSSFMNENGTITEGAVLEETTESLEEQLTLKEPLLSNVRVVYVKDSANQEVTNLEGKAVEAGERLNATGNISDLELILTEEDFQKLMTRVIDKDERLYITYN